MPNRIICLSSSLTTNRLSKVRLGVLITWRPGRDVIRQLVYDADDALVAIVVASAGLAVGLARGRRRLAVAGVDVVRLGQLEFGQVIQLENNYMKDTLGQSVLPQNKHRLA